jgi:hypothetical protein
MSEQEGDGTMRQRPLRVTLILALALGLFTGTVTIGSADVPEGPFEVYFPWVPNGSVISDPRGFGNSGPYYGTVTIQNLEDQTITLGVKRVSAGQLDNFGSYMHMVLGSRGSATFSASQLGVGSPGGGVIAKAVIIGSDEPARIAGVQKQSAPVVQADVARTGALHTIVDGYTGLTEHQVDNAVVVPIVQTNSNWNSILRITNLHSSASTAFEIRLYSTGGEFHSFHEVLTGPGQTVSFDLLQNGVEDGFIGSAFVGGGVNVGVVVERVKNQSSMLIINSARSVEAESDTQYGALVFRNWHGWNTGISVVNLSTQMNTVTIDYYGMDGSDVGSQQMTLMPSGMDFVYSPSGLGSDGVVASAVISGTHPFHASVDEVKYTSVSPVRGLAMSYIVEPHAATSGEALALPLFQKGNSDGSSGDTSGIQLFNPTDDQVTAHVWFFNQDGNLVAPQSDIVIAGKHGVTVYAPEVAGLPVNFTGSAVVGVASGDGAVVAVSNGVNYAVPNDGSLSANLVHLELVWP